MIKLAISERCVNCGQSVTVFLERVVTSMMNAELTHFLGREPYVRVAEAVNHRNGSYTIHRRNAFCGEYILAFLALLALRLRKLRVILTRPTLWRALYWYRVMAAVEHKPVLKRPLTTVVDIGANRGQFALAVREFSKARVFSFEPLVSPADVFKRVFSGDSSVKLFVAAIGPNTEKRKMHISARDDSSSLLEIGQTQSALFPGTHEIGTVEVTVAPLDTYLSADDIIAPAMLKLDVQGFELQALEGCRNLLPSFHYIYCECSFIELYKGQKLAGDVIAYLQGYGFILRGIYNAAYDAEGNCIQADLLFGKAGV